MPQMMPINWLMIFLMCLICLLTMNILLNSSLIYFKMNKNHLNTNNIFKKWTWMW
nr:TPA_asm: ATP8 [Bombus griseocollis]